MFSIATTIISPKNDEFAFLNINRFIYVIIFCTAGYISYAGLKHYSKKVGSTVISAYC